MGWYRREKLALDSFSSLASRVAPQNPIFQRSLRTCPSGYLDSGSKGASFNRFSSFCSISQRLGTRGVVGGVNSNFHNPFLLRAKSFHNWHHSRSTGPRRWLEWLQNPENDENIAQFLRKLLFVMIGSWVLLCVCSGKLETVPFTNRNHFHLMSRATERRIWERKFEDKKAAFKGTILPSTHPESVRVTKIAKDIIDALQRGLRKEEQVWSDLQYASEHAMLVEDNGRETMSALVGREEKVEVSWHKEDEILDDDKWVQQSRKKCQERVSQADSSHLDGWIWEIFVVNEPITNAICFSGGKIIVFTGLFKHFKSDAEIATIIGHEVAHAVARHYAEGIVKISWFLLIPVILLVKPDIVNMMQSLFLLLMSFFFLNQPLVTWGMQIEADYIGLLLMALAGYDPQVAPKVYERLEQITGSDSTTFWDYLYTHRRKRNRAEMLAQAMEEALTIYRDARVSMASSGLSSSCPRSCQGCMG